jgi:hypothetical protein
VCQGGGPESRWRLRRPQAQTRKCQPQRKSAIAASGRPSPRRSLFVLGANLQGDVRRMPPPTTANMVGSGDFQAGAGSIGLRHARGGRNGRRANSPANRLFEIAIAAIWNATARASTTTFAPLPIVAGGRPQDRSVWIGTSAQGDKGLGGLSSAPDDPRRWSIDRARLRRPNR